MDVYHNLIKSQFISEWTYSRSTV